MDVVCDYLYVQKEGGPNAGCPPVPIVVVVLSLMVELANVGLHGSPRCVEQSPHSFEAPSLHIWPNVENISEQGSKYCATEKPDHQRQHNLLTAIWLSLHADCVTICP